MQRKYFLIEGRQYGLELKEHGVNRILHLGSAFQGKEELIRSQAAEDV
jgi:hypothetical protein